MLKTLLSLIAGYDVFISYSHRDGKAYATALGRLLESLGVTVFLDEEDLDYRSTLPSSLRRSIRRSKAFLLVGSEQAVTAAPFVDLEIRYALDRRRLIIPIDRDGVRKDAPWGRVANLVWIEESLGRSSEPSRQVVSQVQHRLRFRRRRTVEVDPILRTVFEQS